MANSVIKQIQVGTSTYDIEPYSTILFDRNAISSALGGNPVLLDVVSSYNSGSVNLGGSLHIYGETNFNAYTLNSTGSIYPSGDGSYDLGSSDHKYNRLYASYVGTNLHPIQSVYASHLSIAGNGQTYISNSYISIYASSYSNATNYSAILLSAAAADARISMYASSIYMSATRGMYCKVTSGPLELIATSGQIYLSATSGNVYITADNGFGVGISLTDYITFKNTDNTTGKITGLRRAGTTASYATAGTANTTASVTWSNSITVYNGQTIHVHCCGRESAEKGCIVIATSTGTTSNQIAYSSASFASQLARADGNTGYWGAQWLNCGATWTNTTGGTRYILFGRCKMTNFFYEYEIFKVN